MKYLVMLALWLTSAFAFAHAPSNAFINLTLGDGKLEGALLLRLDDVALFAALDPDGNRAVTWGEVRNARAAIDEYVHVNLAFASGDAPCEWTTGAHQLEDLLSGRFLHIPVSGSCARGAANLTAHYDLLFQLLPHHRAFLNVRSPDGEYPALLSPMQRSVTVDLEETTARSALLAYLWEGVWHIWIGYDHLAFLLALIVPLFAGSIADEKRDMRPRRRIAIDVLRVVTAFTVAHTLTLVLASTSILVLDLMIVEAVIAISVVLSGLNMIRPIFSHTHWHLAFGFGFIHGFGFASVLSDLTLPDEYFVVSLLSFNAGVELGQLAIVALLFPFLLVMRRYAFYARAFVPLMGIAIATVGVWWTVERVAA